MGSNRTNYIRGSDLTRILESEAEALEWVNEKYGLSLELDAISNPFLTERLEETPQPLEPVHWPLGYEPNELGARLDPVVFLGGQHQVPLIPVRYWHLQHCGPTHALTIAFQRYWVTVHRISTSQNPSR